MNIEQMDIERFINLIRCNKDDIKRMIDNDSEFIKNSYIFTNIDYLNFEIIQFIFEYYEKINKKIGFEYIYYGITTFKRAEILNYLKYQKNIIV